MLTNYQRKVPPGFEAKAQAQVAKICPLCGKDNAQVPAMGGGCFYCIACGALSFVDAVAPGGLRAPTREERHAALSDSEHQRLRYAHLAKYARVPARQRKANRRARP